MIMSSNIEILITNPIPNIILRISDSVNFKKVFKKNKKLSNAHERKPGKDRKMDNLFYLII